MTNETKIARKLSQMKKGCLNLKDRFFIDGKEYLLSTVELPMYDGLDRLTRILFRIEPFKTMLFEIEENGGVNWLDLYYERYGSAVEAEKRHNELVEKARNGVKFWEEE